MIAEGQSNQRPQRNLGKRQHELRTETNKQTLICKHQAKNNSKRIYIYIYILDQLWNHFKGNRIAMPLNACHGASPKI